MNKEQFAKMLDGRQYLSEITKEEAKKAEELGLVVMFGYSDDNVEFRGMIDEEEGACDGTTFYFDKDGLIKNECEDEGCPYHEKRLNAKTTKSIYVSWSPWAFSTDDIPIAKFNVMEDDELFGEGIVFELSALAQT